MDEIAAELTLEIAGALGLELDCKPASVPLYPMVIEHIVDSCFWAEAKSKMYLMGSGGDLLAFKEKDVPKFIAKVFGPIADYKKLREMAAARAVKAKLAPAFVSKAVNLPMAKVIDHLMLHNQRNMIEMRVDMFAAQGRMEIRDEVVRVVYTHTPFEPRLDSYDQAIVDDYLDHFPELEFFLCWIVSARFARDRKRAYIWMHCDSDWGKSFLLAILESFGVTNEISVKEVEKLFEGAPVGASMVDFKRSFALVVDEFKSPRSELKQLQNTISLAPKYQLKQQVEIFAKVFLSAEDVPSLASDEGIEDQFSNRFNYYRGRGDLSQRHMFRTVGRAAYFDNVQTYVAQYLNRMVDSFVSLGPAKAEVRAERYLDTFWASYNISRVFTKFSDNLPQMANEFVDWLITNYVRAKDREIYSGHPSPVEQEFLDNLVRKAPDEWVLLCGSMMVGKWIDAKKDQSARGSIKFKRGQIVWQCSQDGENPKPMRVAGKPVKGVLLRLSSEQLEALEATGPRGLLSSPARTKRDSKVASLEK